MKKQQQKQLYRLSLATAISLSLAACGGGGSEPEPEPAPPINSAPSIGAMSAVSIDERKSTSIDASASDADGSISSYSWSQTSGPDVELSGADTSSVTVNAPTVSADEAVVLTLTVTDDDGATATANVDISVINTHIESRVSGQVLAKGTALTGADVTLTYSDISELAVTDNEGNYSIELLLPLDYSESPYSITATHGSTTLSRVGLISEVVASENESQQSVQKMSLMSSSSSNNDSSQGGAEINEVTTAESELLQSLYADETAFYESVFESLTEFALQYDHISTEKLAELASFLVYMRDNNIEAPEPFTFDSLTALYESYKVSDSDFDTAMDNATNSVIASATKPDSFSTITNATYPLTALPVLESAKNTVRLGINFDTVYQFDSVTDLTVIDNDGGDYAASWSINDDGSLTITRASASGRYTWQSGAGNIDYGSHGTCTHRSLSEDWGMLNKRGGAPDAVLISFNWTVSCEDGFSEQYTTKQYASLVTGSNTRSFRDTDISGKTLAIELPGSELRGDNFIARLLSFASDGSGTDIESNEAFTWMIEGGALKLSFANGDNASLFKVQENSQGATGVVQLFTVSTGETYSNKGMMLQVDEDAVFANAADYIGSLRSGFDVSQPNQQRRMGFVIHLEADGISSQEYTDENGNLRSDLSALTTWGINDNKLINSLKYNDWTNERCDPYSNSNCWWLQVRTWELLAKHGNRIYVRESIRRHSTRPDDNLAFPPLTDSRLNFYQID